MDEALRFLDTYGLIAVFAVLLLKESGIPIPVPGDLILLVAGARAAEGKFPLVVVLATIVGATLIGASIQYFLVRGPGRRFVHRFGKIVGLTPQRLDRAMAAVRARGWRAVGVGRMTPGVRIVTVIAAGLADIPYRWAVLLGLVVGNSVFVAVHVLLGYFVGPGVVSLLGQINVPLIPFILILMVAGLGGWLLKRSRRKLAPDHEHSAGEALADWADASCPVCVTVGRLAQAFEPSGVSM